MSTEKSTRVKTNNGEVYYIRESGGWFYVTRPSEGSVGEAKSKADALAIIENHSGSAIDSMR